MSNEIMLRECDILNVEYKFEDKIQVATDVATALSQVIESQQLYQKFGDNKYVTVDGWNTLGTMLGCTPYVESVEDVTSIFGNGKRKNEKVFQATVSIRRGDTVLARANSICSNTERGKENQDTYAIYSMAQTRAIGKCYRMALGWIIKMGGYSSTPAEEMQEEMVKVNKQKAWNNAKAKTMKTTFKATKKEEPKEENDEGVIEAEIVEKEENKNYDDLIKPFITKVQESGVNVRKPAIMKQIRDSDLDIETQEELIDYVRENLRNSGLKAKYDN